MTRKIAPPNKGWFAGLGKSIAPPRFVLFVVVLALIAVIRCFHTGASWGDGLVVGFDLAVPIFLLSLYPIMHGRTAAEMRRHAEQNDANRGSVLIITSAVTIAMLVAMIDDLPDAKNHETWAMIQLIATLAEGWIFSNVVFALHYAHMFYGAGETAAKDMGGMEFPGTKEPDYWDFIYFSFTAGMSFAASDVNLTSGAVRRVLILQCLLAFIFNIGALAFSINVLAGAAG